MSQPKSLHTASPMGRVHGASEALILGGRGDNEWGWWWREGLKGGGNSTPNLAQVGRRWLRSALLFKEGKLMFFLAKHNIVRGAQ